MGSQRAGTMRQPDGLELHWSAKDVSGVLEFSPKVKNTGAADLKDIRWSLPLAQPVGQTGRLQVHY